MSTSEYPSGTPEAILSEQEWEATLGIAAAVEPGVTRRTMKARLRADREALRAEVERLTTERDEVRTAMAEVERLTEALRALEDAAGSVLPYLDDRVLPYRYVADLVAARNDARAVLGDTEHTTRAQAAEARVAELIEALEKYGQHRPDCDSFGPSHCDCGFRAVLRGLR